MDTKLTLRLKKKVIERAKVNAKDHKVSISHLVEAYLQSLVSDRVEEEEIAPLTKNLLGVAGENIDADSNEDYTDHLEKKYK